MPDLVKADCGTFSDGKAEYAGKDPNGRNREVLKRFVGKQVRHQKLYISEATSRNGRADQWSRPCAIRLKMEWGVRLDQK